MCNVVIIHVVYVQYLGFSHITNNLFLKSFVILIFLMDVAAGTLLFPHCGILKFYLFFRLFLCFSIFILFYFVFANVSSFLGCLFFRPLSSA